MKYEIHSHTKETSQCAKISAKELVEKYKELGYSGIVITNHYSDLTFSLKEMFNRKLRTEHYLAGFREAKKYETEDFSVLLGIELRFFLNGNDYLIYGVTEELVEKMPFLLPMYLKRTAKFFKKHDCIIIQAHPYRPYIYRANPKYLDGVEIVNGKSTKEENDKALKSFVKQEYENIVNALDTKYSPKLLEAYSKEDVESMKLQAHNMSLTF